MHITYFAALVLCILLQHHAVNAFQAMFYGYGGQKTREPVYIVPECTRHDPFRPPVPMSGILTTAPADTPAGSAAPVVRELWLDQHLDHYNPTDLRTWRQRFYANGDLWRAGGCMIIYIGGEWQIEPTSLQGGLYYDIAREHNAMLFYVEHRYYGLSRPTADATTANLRYLKSDQALEDLSRFVAFIQNDVPELANSRVIVFGGSYAGNLAAWFRLKYPHLCYGAVASSAPIFAKHDFWEYFETVGDSLRELGGQQCTDTIRTGMQQIRQELATADGAANIQRLFRLCSTVSNNSPLDVATFLMGVAATFSHVVQYHDGVTNDIQRDCQRLADSTAAGNSPLVALSIHFLTKIPGTGCVNALYNDYISSYANTNWGSSSTNGNMRQWLYQLCTEGSYSQTFTSPNQPFGRGDNTREFHEQICEDLFQGPFINNATEIIDRAARRANTINGGRDPAVTRVIFSNGSLDPWKRLGRLTDLNDESPAVLVQGTSHAQDLKSISDSDSPDMRLAKMRIQRTVGEWITE